MNHSRHECPQWQRIFDSKGIPPTGHKGAKDRAYEAWKAKKAAAKANKENLKAFGPGPHQDTEIEDDSGKKMKLECNERYYVPSEITWLLKSLGYKKIDIYGARNGAFSRKDLLSTKDFEMLVLAEK